MLSLTRHLSIALFIVAVTASAAHADMLILSADTTDTSAGVDFRSADLVEYSPVTGEASIYFSEDTLALGNNINAVRNVAPETGTLLLIVLGGLLMLFHNRGRWA